jgi:hypothetical protein
MSKRGPFWFRAHDGYRSKIGWFFFCCWYDLAWFKQEICWQILGRTHIRKR